MAFFLNIYFFYFINEFDDSKKYNLFRIIFAIFVFLPIQYALKAQQNIARLQLEKEQLQTENYKAQLKVLRAQIDPHFLFNSLNTLRTMVRYQHSNSEHFIMSLSDFYRQILKHNENNTLPLYEELKVLQSYLFLMKSRNEEAISINLDIDPSLYHFHLPGLALQVLLENCFKHNSMTSKKPLLIEIKNTDEFYIMVKNNIQPKIGDNDSSGYGLELLKKRYALMKVQKGVIINKTPEYFSVKLKLL
jgi:LytS/YehU family sensor histidine kinase